MHADFVRNLSAEIVEAPRRRAGLTVVGDIHGMRSSAEAAVAHARARNHFILFLGDVIDYGPHSLETADLVHDLVVDGHAAMIRGNHERKIARWLDQGEAGEITIQVSHGNQATIDAVEALPEGPRAAWIARFRHLLARSTMMAEVGDLVFAHGAVHPSFWTGLTPKAAESYAYFGQVDRSAPMIDGYPVRTYGWADEIPAGMTVIVGHDVRSPIEPLVVEGARGGRAIFLDTGSAKGGRLSVADYRLDGDGLRFEAFRHF